MGRACGTYGRKKKETACRVLVEKLEDHYEKSRHDGG
jgi:hypothetical protein